MKRFPLSKKAVALTLAAVMATTPFVGSVAAVDGGVSTQDAHEEVTSVNQVVADVEAIYASLNAEDQATIAEMRAVIDGLSDDAWHRAVPDVMIENIDAALGEGETIAIVKEIAMILTTVEEGELQSAVDDFRDSRSGDFNTVFNGEITVDDLLALFDELTHQAVAFMNEGDRRDLSREELASALSAVDLEEFARENLDVGDINQAFYNGTGVYLVDTANQNDVLSFADHVRDLIIEEGTFTAEELRHFTAGLMLAAVEYFDPQVDEEPVVTERDGDKVIVRVNEDAYLEYLNELEEVPNVISLDVDKEDGEIGEVIVPAAVAEAILDRNPRARIEVTSPEGSASLRVADVNTVNLRAALGIDADAPFDLVISINPGTDSGNAIARNNLDVKSQIVNFTMHAVSGDNSYNINRFMHTLKRSIVASEDLTEGRTVVLRLNSDGTVTPVTTKVEGNRAHFSGFSNSNYVVTENTVTYPDMNTDHWAYDEVSDLSSQYIIQGFLDGNFRPEVATKRSQFSALVTRALSLVPEDDYTEPFSDVLQRHTLVDEILAASNYGIVQGYGDTTFRPEHEITRAEAAIMITRVMDLLDDVDFDLDESVDYTTYTDSDRFSARQQDAITRVTQAGIMQGRGDGSFRPDDSANRGQLSLMLHRLLQKADYIN